MKLLYHASSATVIKLKRGNAVSHLEIPNRSTLNGKWQNHRRLQIWLCNLYVSRTGAVLV